MRLKKSLLCGICLSLGACASSYGPAHYCPQVAIVRPLEKIEDYGEAAIAPETLVATAQMDAIKGECRYKNKGVDIAFDLVFSAQKGPALTGGKKTFPFFVSIVDPEGIVKSKEMMTAGFSFEKDKAVAALTQPLRVYLPLPDNKLGESYRILTGFQLTQAQVQAVREAQKKTP